MIELCDYLVREHDVNGNNITFSGDEIKLLGDTQTLGIDEAKEDEGFISTGLYNRFQKAKINTEKWASTGN